MAKTKLKFNVSVNRLYMVKKDTAGFKAGDIVEGFAIQPYTTKKYVTDRKIIGKWKCCNCPKYKADFIRISNLEFIGNL